MRGTGRGMRWLAALLCGLLLLPAPASALTGTARFYAQKDIAYAIRFEDGYFDTPGTSYQQPLALSSLGLALSAFRVRGGDLQGKGSHVQSYLGELGFEQLSLKQYDIAPSQQTIATAMGSKTLSLKGGSRMPLIAVAISGGGYQDEWKSNFAVGSGQHHEGFDQAAQQVVSRLKDYIKAQGIQAPFKLWITGYSRAAATANRSAAILLDAALVRPEHLYAYTFATPNVTRQSTAALYPSIYNLVGAFDPVPMIPFAEWGYRRYGQTGYLPSPQTNSDYQARSLPVQLLYRLITGGSYWVNLSSNEALRKTLGALSQSIPDAGSYSGQFQPWLIQLWGMRGNTAGMLRYSLNELIGSKERRQQLGSAIGSVLDILSNAMGEKIMQDSGELGSQWQGEAGLMQNLVHEHMPTIYLSWLAAYRDRDSMISPSVSYRQAHLQHFGALKVLDAQDKQVMALDMQALTSLKEGSALPLTVIGDEVVLTLPSDREYRLQIEPVTDQPLRLTLREGQAGHSRLIGYELAGEALPQGQRYELRLPPGAPVDGGYALRWPGGQRALIKEQGSHALSQGEMSSPVSATLRDSLSQVIALAISLLVQIIFYIVLGFRLAAWRRQRRGQPLPGYAMRYRMLYNPGLRLISLTKALAALLLLLALAMLAAGLYMLWLWRLETPQQGQELLRWYTTLYLVPNALLMFNSGVPALAAALFHLIWRGGLRRLRTGRLFLIMALLFSLVQWLLSHADTGLPQARLIPMLSLAQIVLLLILLPLAWRCGRREKRLISA